MGIGAAVASAVTAISSAFAGIGGTIAGGLGLADATLGGFGAGALIGGGLEGAAGGALLGGGLSAVEGKPILTGALEGAGVGGLTAGLGPAIGGLTGLGTIGGEALAGAGAGALGSAVTGGNVATGALTGGVGGLASGALSSFGSAPTDAAGATAAGGPGASAGATAAPASVGADLPLEGPTATGATLDTVSGLQGPTPSGVPLGATPAGAAPLQGPTPSGESLAGATAGVDVPPPGTPLAAPDIATLQQQINLAPQLAPGNTSQQDFLGGLFGSGDNTDGLATSPGGGTTVQDVNTFPVPPQPPMLNASGNPVTDATGNLVYASPGLATYAGNETAAAASNFSNPSVSDTALNGATAGTAGGNSIGNLFSDPSLGNLGKALSSNATLLLGGAALGYDALKGTQPPKGLSELTGEANQLGTQSQQLESYLTSGTLPPGVQTALNQGAQQAAATIRSQYAARGMSGSSAEAADLANVQNTVISKGASIATQLLQTGVSEAGLASQLYSAIMNQSVQSDASLGNALSTLATLSATASKPNVVLNAAAA